MGLILLILGIAIGAVGGIWLLVKAFQAGVLWGLGSLFVPLVSLIFVITHWQEAKKPFLVNVAGVALMIAGVVLSPDQTAGVGFPR
jgi:hypothetical protein